MALLVVLGGTGIFIYTYAETKARELNAETKARELNESSLETTFRGKLSQPRGS